MQMHPDKSPGPDGFNPAFYQRFWDLIGDDVYRDSLEWMNNLCFPPSVNHTNICLIPKHQNSKTITTRKKLINDTFNASWKSYNDAFLKCHDVD